MHLQHWKDHHEDICQHHCRLLEQAESYVFVPYSCYLCPISVKSPWLKAWISLSTAHTFMAFFIFTSLNGLHIQYSILNCPALNPRCLNNVHKWAKYTYLKKQKTHSTSYIPQAIIKKIWNELVNSLFIKLYYSLVSDISTIFFNNGSFFLLTTKRNQREAGEKQENMV